MCLIFGRPRPKSHHNWRHPLRPPKRALIARVRAIFPSSRLPFWPRSRLLRSRRDPPDRAGSSSIGCAAKIGAGNTEDRPLRASSAIFRDKIRLIEGVTMLAPPRQDQFQGTLQKCGRQLNKQVPDTAFRNSCPGSSPGGLGEFGGHSGVQLCRNSCGTVQASWNSPRTCPTPLGGPPKSPSPLGNSPGNLLGTPCQERFPNFCRMA